MLADGLISYYYFPKMTPIDELLMESKIVDFQLYNSEALSEEDPTKTIPTQCLATLNQSQELKIFSLQSNLDFIFISKIQLNSDSA